MHLNQLNNPYVMNSLECLKKITLCCFDTIYKENCGQHQENLINRFAGLFGNIWDVSSRIVKTFINRPFLF